MYITEEDLLKGIYSAELDSLKQDGADVDTAITEAIEEVRGYLDDRYDMTLELTRTGATRNARIVGLVRDIAIYNCFKNSSPNRISDIRVTIYRDTVKALVSIQSERASIKGLTRNTGEDTTSSYLAHGGNPKRSNHY